MNVDEFTLVVGRDEKLLKLYAEVHGVDVSFSSADEGGIVIWRASFPKDRNENIRAYVYPDGEESIFDSAPLALCIVALFDYRADIVEEDIAMIDYLLSFGVDVIITFDTCELIDSFPAVYSIHQLYAETCKIDYISLYWIYINLFVGLQAGILRIEDDRYRGLLLTAFEAVGRCCGVNGRDFVLPLTE